MKEASRENRQCFVLVLQQQPILHTCSIERGSPWSPILPLILLMSTQWSFIEISSWGWTPHMSEVPNNSIKTAWLQEFIKNLSWFFFYPPFYGGHYFHPSSATDEIVMCPSSPRMGLLLFETNLPSCLVTSAFWWAQEKLYLCILSFFFIIVRAWTVCSCDFQNPKWKQNDEIPLENCSAVYIKAKAMHSPGPNNSAHRYTPNGNVKSDDQKNVHEALFITTPN